jgi:hypothetical protein
MVLAAICGNGDRCSCASAGSSDCKLRMSKLKRTDIADGSYSQAALILPALGSKRWSDSRSFEVFILHGPENIDEGNGGDYDDDEVLTNLGSPGAESKQPTYVRCPEGKPSWLQTAC